jgi:hypothetical protein
MELGARAICHDPGPVGGLELVPPGLVAGHNWRGGWRDVAVTPPGPAHVLAGGGTQAMKRAREASRTQSSYAAASGSHLRPTAALPCASPS